MNIQRFITNSILLGAGLAMDAFSVCIANGLNEIGMKSGRKYMMAGVFGLFQMLMPLAGWVCVRTIAEQFSAFQRFIPWIALVLLLYIGGKMIYEAYSENKAADARDNDRRSIYGQDTADSGDSKEGILLKSGQTVISGRQLFIQGVATSIDALSVGFAIAEYSAAGAFVSSIIIGIVTFIICLAGLSIGRKAGERLAGKANVTGGIILICIGLEIAFL